MSLINLYDTQEYRNKTLYLPNEMKFPPLLAKSVQKKGFIMEKIPFVKFLQLFINRKRKKIAHLTSKGISDFL